MSPTASADPSQPHVSFKLRKLFKNDALARATLDLFQPRRALGKKPRSNFRKKTMCKVVSCQESLTAPALKPGKWSKVTKGLRRRYVDMANQRHQRLRAVRLLISSEERSASREGIDARCYLHIHMEPWTIHIWQPLEMSDLPTAHKGGNKSKRFKHTRYSRSTTDASR